MLSIDECYNVAEKCCDICECIELIDLLDIRYCKRTKKHLGLCTHIKITQRSRSCSYKSELSHSSRYDIKLAYKFAKEFDKVNSDEMEDTLIHEVCHAIEHYKTGRMSDHGPVWKDYMVQCGGKPEKYYKGKVRVPKKLLDCRCTSCGEIIQLTPTLVTRRMNQNSSIGYHIKCGRKSTILPPQEWYDKHVGS